MMAVGGSIKKAPWNSPEGLRKLTATKLCRRRGTRSGSTLGQATQKLSANVRLRQTFQH